MCDVCDKCVCYAFYWGIFFSCVFYRFSWCERRIQKLSVVMDDDVVAAAANGLFCVHSNYSHLILFDWFRFCTSTLTLNSLFLSLCQPNWHVLYTHYFQFNSLFGFLLFNDLLLMFFFFVFSLFFFLHTMIALRSLLDLIHCACVLVFQLHLMTHQLKYASPVFYYGLIFSLSLLHSSRSNFLLFKSHSNTFQYTYVPITSLCRILFNFWSNWIKWNKMKSNETR